MKIHLCSDLHLECGYQELPGGEVLILAGDIAESRSVLKHHHSTKILQDTPDTKYACSEFFKYECAKYDRVFYVMGNHEHYHGRIDKTYEELKSFLPKNVRLLENECEEYKGILFLGGTLWTDCNRANPISIHDVRFGMNDYRAIKMHNTSMDTYHRLTPEFTMNLHRKTVNYFRDCLSANSNKPAVVITHHGPTNLSINQKYHNDPLNAAYVSDLSDLILDHENIQYWVHGHMHDRCDYMIGKTRVVTNPRGYVGYEDTSQFDPNFYFEL